MNRAERVQVLERASEGLREMEAQRDRTAEELRRQVEECADLRRRLEASQAALAAREAATAEHLQLINVAYESLGQVRTRLGGG